MNKLILFSLLLSIACQQADNTPNEPEQQTLFSCQADYETCDCPTEHECKVLSNLYKQDICDQLAEDTKNGQTYEMDAEEQMSIFGFVCE